MNLTKTNRRAAFFAASALAGIGAIATLPQSAHAQTGGATKPHTMPGKPGGMNPATSAKRDAARKKLMDELHVTPDQEAKLKKVQADGIAKMRAASSNKSLTNDQKQAQIKDIRAKTFAQMSAVMTPEQRTKIKARMQHEQAGGMTKGGPAKPGH